MPSTFNILFGFYYFFYHFNGFVCFPEIEMHFISRSSLLVIRHVVLHNKFCSKPPPELPEEPTTCCMSGCANCVWIEYAEQVKNILANSDSKQVTQIILDKVQDPNMKAFLSMELKSKGL